jgi:predicted lactoylglutathione lyase
MNVHFPMAAPELPVKNLERAGVYYEKCLGFKWDWGVEGIGQVSKGSCRIILTDNAFRNADDTGTPVVIWINLENKAEVDALHESWNDSGATILEVPESKPYNLYEFVAEDLDGNRFRVFYDFAWELPDRGGRRDDSKERQQALSEG